MTKFRHGDMLSTDNWKAVDLVLITTNSSVLSGKLVMGAGIARQVRDDVLNIDGVLGEAVVEVSEGFRSFKYRNRWYMVYDPYYLLISPYWPEQKLGLFQVKTEFYKKASIELIEESCQRLRQWCMKHSGMRVNLNFPGIGYGRLSRDEILPIVENLPDTVTIWEL